MNIENTILDSLNLDIILSFILGTISGLLANQIGKWWKKVQLRLADRKSRKNILKYDSEKDELYMINRWSIKRPLTKDNHKVVISTSRPKQEFIPVEELENEIKRQKELNRAGDICFLTDFQIDHYESDFGRDFSITISPCDYSEHMAVYEYLEKHTDIKKKIEKIIASNPKEYLRNALPSNITVNVVVLSEGNFLAIKRSKSVDTARNIWTVGPFETMTLKRDISPGSEEDLFTLSRRCLNEELNLGEDYYGKIFISWFGLLIPSVRSHVVAVVKIKNINEGEVIKRAMNSHSNFESENFEWLPLNKNTIKTFVEKDKGKLNDREWIRFTKLSLTEALRIKDNL